MRSVGGAEEVEGGARRGHWSRDSGAEKLPRTDNPQPGLTSDFCSQHLCFNI